MKLSNKERRFVSEYLKDQNGAKAAIRSGYSKKSARSQASRLLTKENISAAVQKGLTAIEEKNNVSAGRVLKELGRIAFVDPIEFYMDDGITLKPLHQMSEGARRAVSSIDAEEIFEGVGQDRENVGDLKKLRLVSKLGALELLGKHHKLFTDKVEIGVSEDLAAAILAARKRKARAK